MILIQNKLRIFIICLYIPIIILTACGRSFTDNAGLNNENPFSCPLRVHPQNPRYFTDGSDKVIYLTGSYDWRGLKDVGQTDPPPVFDYNGYLDFLQQYNHNFIRLWTCELTKFSYENHKGIRYARPFPWQRRGPGKALDGKPKFDLRKFNKKYFNRLRSRVIAARDRGIYVSIMLFEGHGIYFSQIPWRWDGHPLNVNNNINGIDGDPNKDGKGLESHTLQIPSIVKLQEKYVKKVIDTVNDLDNVLYEISNEDHDGSIEWQYHMINFIHDYEKTKAKQHPVGMTTHVGLGNDVVFNSDAEWISPAVSKWGDNNDPYKVNPPVADGSKVILLDTDHLWGEGGDGVWVWKSFTRGYNPIYNDDSTDYSVSWFFGEIQKIKWQWNKSYFSNPMWLMRAIVTIDENNRARESARRAMGYTLAYANKMDLTDMSPINDLASTAYCLANPGSEYLIYQPESNTPFTVNLISGTYAYEWFNPNSGTIVSTGTLTTEGGNQSFNSPFDGDAVLYIHADNEHSF